MESEENPQIFLKKLREKQGLDRVGLLSYIDEVCRISFQKLYTKNLQSSEKASWARVIVSLSLLAVHSSGMRS